MKKEASTDELFFKPGLISSLEEVALKFKNPQFLNISINKYIQIPWPYFEFNTDGFITVINPDFQKELNLNEFSQKVHISDILNIEGIDLAFYNAEKILEKEGINLVGNYKKKTQSETEFQIVFKSKNTATGHLAGFSGIILKNPAGAFANKKENKQTELLANMSHEIRTPVNVMVGFARLLHTDKDLNERHKEFTGHIINSGELLVHLINDIIDVSQLEAGKIKIYPIEFDLYAFFNKLMPLLQQYLRDKGHPGVQLMLDMPTNLPCGAFTVKTDERRLQQIITNLVSNAIKFTQEGHIKIGFRLYDCESVYFFVEDTGIGIAKEDQERIFFRHQQAGLSSHASTEGSGLGLAIVQGLLKCMKGELNLTSNPGSGSCFSFVLPLMEDKLSIVNHKQPKKDKILLLVSNNESQVLEIQKKISWNLIYREQLSAAYNLCNSDFEIDAILVDESILKQKQSPRNLKRLQAISEKAPVLILTKEHQPNGYKPNDDSPFGLSTINIDNMDALNNLVD